MTMLALVSFSVFVRATDDPHNANAIDTSPPSNFWGECLIASEPNITLLVVISKLSGQQLLSAELAINATLADLAQDHIIYFDTQKLSTCSQLRDFQDESGCVWLTAVAITDSMVFSDPGGYGLWLDGRRINFFRDPSTMPALSGRVVPERFPIEWQHDGTKDVILECELHRSGSEMYRRVARGGQDAIEIWTLRDGPSHDDLIAYTKTQHTFDNIHVPPAAGWVSVPHTTTHRISNVRDVEESSPLSEKQLVSSYIRSRNNGSH